MNSFLFLSEKKQQITESPANFPYFIQAVAFPKILKAVSLTKKFDGIMNKKM